MTVRRHLARAASPARSRSPRTSRPRAAHVPEAVPTTAPRAVREQGAA
jgi:hypothetical protein